MQMSAHDLVATRDCAQPLCSLEAEPGSEWCRDHDPSRPVRTGEPIVLAPTPARKPTGPRPKWTKELIVAAMHRWAAEHDGHAPSNQFWARVGEYWPSQTTVVHRFGSWSAAVNASGLKSAREVAQDKQRELSKRQGRAPKAPEASPPGSPATTQAEGHEASVAVCQESPEQPLDPAELGARSPAEPPTTEVAKQEEPEDAWAEALIPAPETEPLGFSLALTGDFTRDAMRVRQEAEKLRAQAAALDTIATGIDQLAAA
jgi:hypothetical protein